MKEKGGEAKECAKNIGIYEFHFWVCELHTVEFHVKKATELLVVAVIVVGCC